jgi:hypothetical protein
MPECASCKAFVPADAESCPECGAPVDEYVEAAQDLSLASEETVHTVLLNAHLLKIRGDSEAAISECIKALRMNPDSVEAHTLLGDIYKAQGKIDDAIHWYKMGLDLSPDNLSSRERLKQISTNKPPVLPRYAPAVEPPSAPARRPILVAALCAGLCILAVVVGILLLKTSRAPHGTALVSPNRTGTSSPPINLQPPAQGQEQGQVETNVTVAPSATSQSEDPDSALVSEMNGAPVLMNSGLHIVGTSYDPRYDYRSITFACPDTQGAPSADTIVQQSATIAKEIFSLDNTFDHLTIRALGRIPADGVTKLEPLFVADITREKAAQIDPQSSSNEAQLAAFENPWWSSTVK